MKEYFPDGTLINDWFYKTPDLPSNESHLYSITDYGATNDGSICTNQIQNTIDEAYKAGGGTVVIPEGIFFSGSVFFKKGVNLYLEKNAVLKGSADIGDYPVCIFLH